MAKISIAFFATPTEQGQDLARRFQHLLKGYPQIELQTQTDASQAVFARDCMKQDLVIFDATIEPDGRHNYKAASLQPTVMDHILVVSRTYLPVNFAGLRRGGAPAYPNPYTDASGTFSNAQIISWLQQQLELLLPRLPRPWYEKGVLGSQVATFRSLSAKSSGHRRVFFRYRSRDLIGDGVKDDLDDLQHHATRSVVEQLERIQQQAAAGKYEGVPAGTEVRFVPPGELAFPNEVLTEYRRWQVMAIIDRDWLGEADETWVCDTPNYLGSWWTQVEVAALSWRALKGPSGPTIRLFDPKTGTLTDPPADFLFTLSPEQEQRWRRTISAADPATTSPEYIPAFRGQGRFPVAGQVPYTSGRPWTNEFWLHPLVPCACQSNDPASLRAAAGIDALLDIAGEPRLSVEAWDRCIKQGTVTCRSCGTVYRLKSVAPRYLWMPTRLGQPTGPEGASLIEFPTFRMVR